MGRQVKPKLHSGVKKTGTVRQDMVLREASIFYTEKPVSGRPGKPVKIPADFDTALDALIAVPSPKKRRKAGRP